MKNPYSSFFLSQDIGDVTSKTAPTDKNGGSNGGTTGVGTTVQNNNCGSLATVDGSAGCNATAANNNNGGSGGGGGGGGFNSLPSSIHHGLSERLQGLTDKLHALGGSRSQDSEGVRSRTGERANRTAKKKNLGKQMRKDIMFDIFVSPFFRKPRNTGAPRRVRGRGAHEPRRRHGQELPYLPHENLLQGLVQKVQSLSSVYKWKT